VVALVLVLLMTSDPYVLDAGWVFLGACGVIVAVVSVAAFGRDLLPSRPLTNLLSQPLSDVKSKGSPGPPA